MAQVVCPIKSFFAAAEIDFVRATSSRYSRYSVRICRTAFPFFSPIISVILPSFNEIFFISLSNKLILYIFGRCNHEKYTQILADYLADLMRISPAEVIERAKMVTLHTVGVALGAARAKTVPRGH